jgi:hypothetical protein
LSEALQRNAKPRKRHDFRHLKDGLYAAKREASFSNISGFSVGQIDPNESEIELVHLPTHSPLPCAAWQSVSLVPVAPFFVSLRIAS